MKLVQKLIIGCVCSCTMTATLTAQTDLSTAKPKMSETAVTIAATKTGIRITAPDAVVQLRFEVYDAGARKLFDTEQRGGSVLDWQIQGGDGARLLSGAYVCVVTIKDLSGSLTQRIAAVEVAEQKATVRSTKVEHLNSQQLQMIGLIPPDAELVIVDGGDQTPASVITHDGEQGQITRTRGAFSFRFGDIFRGQDVEQMTLTEAGDLGLGTSQPKSRLDVAGDIRASGFIQAGKGIRFADGTTWTTGSSASRAKTASFTTSAAGTGTQGRLAKWIDNLGTLGDSVVTEASGNLGLGNANPQSLLHIGPFAGYGTTNGLLLGNNLLGTQFDRSVQVSPVQIASPGFNSVLMYVLPTVNPGVTVPRQYGLFIDGKQGTGTITSYAALGTGQVGSLGATNNTHLLLGQGTIPSGNFALFDATGFNSSFSGSVGIGKTNPTHKLDVVGNINTTTQYNINGVRVLGLPGTNNTFLGLDAGTPAGSGTNNSFFGRAAGLNTTGSSNSFFGSSAGGLNSTGATNSFFGRNAGFSNTVGSGNSFFGSNAGDSNFNGSNLTVVGAGADVMDNLTNATAIGNLARVDQSNSLVLGSIAGINAATADTNVGIGTTTPGSKLEVRNGEISATGPTGGRFAANNPNNQGARVLFDWFSDGAKDWPRIRFGGNGEGSQNGFLIQGPGDATKLAVLQNGNVGIGLTNPAAKLTIRGSGLLGDPGAARFDLFNSTADTTIFQHVLDDGRWQLGNLTSPARVTLGSPNDGNTGVKFTLSGLGDLEDVTQLELVKLGTIFTFEVDSGAMNIRKDGTEVMRLTGNRVNVNTTFGIGESTSGGAFVMCHNGFFHGFAALGDCGSSIRYKTNVQGFSSGLELISRLRPVSFDWKATGMHDLGLIAEEVAEIEPLLTTYNKEGKVEGVKYERLGVVLINAIREQQAQIEQLRRSISALEQQNKELSSRMGATQKAVGGVIP